jgi:hypothetical protein
VLSEPSWIVGWSPLPGHSFTLLCDGIIVLLAVSATSIVPNPSLRSVASSVAPRIVFAMSQHFIIVRLF